MRKDVGDDLLHPGLTRETEIIGKRGFNGTNRVVYFALLQNRNKKVDLATPATVMSTNEKPDEEKQEIETQRRKQNQY